jgi:hypothetical protein
LLLLLLEHLLLVDLLLELLLLHLGIGILRIYKLQIRHLALVVQLLELALSEVEGLLIELLLLLLVLALVGTPLEEIVRLLRIEITLGSLPVRYRLTNEQRLPSHLSHRRTLRELNPVLAWDLNLTLIELGDLVFLS